MKIFFDTNIFIDILLDRKFELNESLKIFEMVGEGEIEGFLEAITINNIFYISRKYLGKGEIDGFLSGILDTFEVCSINKNLLKKAIKCYKKDFEDYLQYLSAIENGCDILITRNKKDFPQTELIEVLSPKEFVEKYKLIKK